MLGFIVSHLFVWELPNQLTWPIAGILHNLSDLKRMALYVAKGQAGTASNQYNDYLLLASDYASSATYTMHTPVEILATRSEFEHDATAAYQNALVRDFKLTTFLYNHVHFD
jgi:hypothetical protein